MNGNQILHTHQVGRTCSKGRGAKHSCERAIVLCGKCRKRTCPHLSGGAERYDIITGKRIGALASCESAIVIGTCGSCRIKRAAWSLIDMINDLRALGGT